MTLDEYWNQSEPVRKPYVELKHGEFQLGLKQFVGGKVLQQVFLLNVPKEHSDISNEYVTVNVSVGSEGRIARHLRTTDRDGNPKGFSVFHLPQDINDCKHGRTTNTQ